MTRNYFAHLLRPGSRSKDSDGQMSMSIIILFVILFGVPTTNAFCPKRCVCDESKLEVTCLESTGLQAVPHTFNPLTQKIVINFANATLFSGLDLYGQLEMLDLSHNNITSIDLRVLNQNSRLQSLNASHNMIASLVDSIVNPRRDEPGLDPIIDEDSYLRMPKFELHELYLSHNRLMTLSNFLFLRMSNLRRLDLSHNHISIIEHYAFVGNQKIESLNLRANRLLQVPSSALSSLSLRFSGSSLPSSESSQLKQLDLSDNHISQIQPGAFPPLRQLLELYLESCDIQRLEPRVLSNTPYLMLLSLDHNQLDLVPSDLFVDVPQLRVLQLSSNQIRRIPVKAFSSLSQLEDLTLNNCSLREIADNSFDGLQRLRRLEISSNADLSYISTSAFSSLYQLRYLNLNSNSIQSLRAGIPNLSLLTILDMRNNPIECHCDIQWLGQWLRDFDNKTRSIQRALRPILTGQEESLETNNLPSTIAAASPIKEQRRRRDATSGLFELRSTRSVEPFDLWLADSQLTRDIVDLRCSGPAALAGRYLVELHRDKLECLEPVSQLHVTLGLILLGAFSMLMLGLCLINVCFRRKYLLRRLKNNLVMGATTNIGMTGDSEIYEAKLKEMQDFNLTASHVYTIQSAANNLYDTNLSYGPIGDGCPSPQPIYHQPDEPGDDPDSQREPSHHFHPVQRTYTDL